MQRPWLAQYPAGVPAEIDLRQFTSLNDMLEKTCARFGERAAFSSMGTAMTFRQLDQASRAFGA
jgi:long-chain acyl-CoA synthetase